MWAGTRPESPRIVRFRISNEPASQLFVSGFAPDIAVSPDGDQIAYVAGTQTRGFGAEQLTVRHLQKLESEVLVATGSLSSPFFSPDGQFLGYVDQGGDQDPELMRVPVQGGSPATICRVPGRGPGTVRSASWGRDGTIVFDTSSYTSGLWRVPAVGGEPQQLTMPDAERGETEHLWPEILPGGKSVLFTIASNPIEESQIAVLSLETLERKVVLRGGSYARYSPTGHLVYSAQGSIWAVGFDLRTRETAGNPVPMQESVTTKPMGAANFGISQDGSLIYSPPQLARARALVWVDRDGAEEPIEMTPRDYRSPSLSGDGKHIVASVGSIESGGNLFRWDVDRRVEQQVTFSSTDRGPLWSPDGKQVAFASRRDGQQDVYVIAADGSATVQRLTDSVLPQAPQAWLPDGEALLLGELNSDTGVDIVLLDLGAGGQTEKLLQTEAVEYNPAIAPNGRWMAYRSDGSGFAEVYVRPFPDVTSEQPRLIGPGTDPMWGPDGRELFYRLPGKSVMVVDVETGDRFDRGTPRPLFPDTYFTSVVNNWDMSPDSRFLMIKKDASPVAATEIVVVLNWMEELKRLVPVD